MHATRSPAVAGLFYPADPQVLQQDVDRLMTQAAHEPRERPPKALIVPHAGYIYSGEVAARAYAALEGLAGRVQRVVLFGPAHRVPVRGLALPGAKAFDTPLGAVPIDQDGVAQALRLPDVAESAGGHATEHALEVQLPFLQRVLGRFRLLPFVVGAARAEQVARVMDSLWGGDETLLVVSSDLSHYHSYAAAREIDRATVEQVLAFSPVLDHEQACGATAINGLLLCARARGLRAELLDLRNSGDTAGDRSRVVGYAAFAFYETPVRGENA